MESDLRSSWHPIASSSDAPKRHIFHAQLLGREFAVWRADDGFVNVWENRCLHRGVRLTLGMNDGSELVCRYHAWRYASRTAGCTYIPAHPADAPARRICNITYPAREAWGMIWAGERASGDVPELEGFDRHTVLRPLPVNASSGLVLDELASLDFGARETGRTTAAGAIGFVDPSGASVLFFVQPQDSGKSVVRGILDRELEGDEKIRTLAEYSRLLNAARDSVEAKASAMPAPEPMVVEIQAAEESPPDFSDAGGIGRTAELRLRVAEKSRTAEDVVNLKLESIKGALPTFQPGAHIDLHLQNGLVRQYSLTNGPAETSHYSIGVQREPGSRGGSAAIHDSVAVGDVIAASAPRNGFPLRRDALKTVLVAGGIGITPLLSMAQALRKTGLDFELHYFVRSDGRIAFRDRLAALGDSVVLHKGLSPGRTGEALKRIANDPGFAKHMYVCGPGPMLSAARATAQAAGWADDAVHFEYFKNETEIDTSAEFTVELARSAMTLQVPAGRSILDVLRGNGIRMPSSCEQGACGTCKAGLIEGEALHQDVCLSESEKSRGETIVTCVSRAKSDRLILDL